MSAVLRCAVPYCLQDHRARAAPRGAALSGSLPGGTLLRALVHLY